MKTVTDELHQAHEPRHATARTGRKGTSYARHPVLCPVSGMEREPLSKPRPYPQDGGHESRQNQFSFHVHQMHEGPSGMALPEVPPFTQPVHW